MDETCETMRYQSGVGTGDTDGGSGTGTGATSEANSTKRPAFKWNASLTAPNGGYSSTPYGTHFQTVYGYDPIGDGCNFIRALFPLEARELSNSNEDIASRVHMLELVEKKLEDCANRDAILDVSQTPEAKNWAWEDVVHHLKGSEVWPSDEDIATDKQATPQPTARTEFERALAAAQYKELQRAHLAQMDFYRHVQENIRPETQEERASRKLREEWEAWLAEVNPQGES
jgi:hypothetical protein